MSEDFAAFVEAVESQFTELRTRIDAQEQLFANLLKAYLEMNTAVEGIIAELMSPRSEAERERFRQDLNARHLGLLREMQGVVDVVERSGQNDPTSPIVRMAAEQQVDPAVWERGGTVGGDTTDAGAG